MGTKSLHSFFFAHFFFLAPTPVYKFKPHFTIQNLDENSCLFSHEKLRICGKREEGCRPIKLSLALIDLPLLFGWPSRDFVFSLLLHRHCVASSLLTLTSSSFLFFFFFLRRLFRKFYRKRKKIVFVSEKGVLKSLSGYLFFYMNN